MKPSWYWHRLRCMSGAEILWRGQNKIRQSLWRRRAGAAWPVPPAAASWTFRPPPAMPAQETAALVRGAEAVLRAPWPIFDACCDLTMPDPDWHRDPRTGQATPADRYAFDIRYRDAAQVRNVKHVWEVSRLHHVTLLASAYAATRDTRFSDHAIAHLESWWRSNPPLRGVHWISGIEMGLRLIGFVWTRRLLDGVPGIGRVFEQNSVFQQQLHAHQAWIAAFHSRHSSANNHVIAEMAGLLSAALAFPLFPESAGWARLAASVLNREAGSQTFPDGLNRELASEYHGFVLELLLIAGTEADHAGQPLPDPYWRTLRRMADALAATVDAHGRTARQGDSDSGRALLLDTPALSPVTEVLGVCARIFGAAPWWPASDAANGVSAALLGGLARPRREEAWGKTWERPATRPDRFPDAGMTLLRDPAPGPEEIWCRLDHGPHGFLSTAAHAHADALSIELRLGGQEILIDPGTYCYHDERAWRDYFRSTLAHNTLEVNGRDQAVQAGPFLWLTRPRSWLTLETGSGEGPKTSVTAAHDGYATCPGGPVHHRRVTLDRDTRALTIADWLESTAGAEARLAFHFHPEVEATLEGTTVHLRWTASGARREAFMALPAALTWRARTGAVDPVLGWYSPAFAQRQPCQSLIGSGALAPRQTLHTRIVFARVTRAQVEQTGTEQTGKEVMA